MPLVILVVLGVLLMCICVQLIQLHRRVRELDENQEHFVTRETFRTVEREWAARVEPAGRQESDAEI